MPILVAYDHSIFSFQEQGGISRYFVELAKHLSTEPEVKTHVVAPVHVCQMLNTYSASPKTGIYIPKLKKTYRLLQVVNNVLSRPLMRQLQPDIVHATYYLAQYKLPSSCIKVITVFDMIHEKFSEKMNSFEKTLPDIKRKVVDDADHVICISEQTRCDVIELLGVEKDRTSVIHLASSFSGLESPGATGLERPYFLYVGSREWPKNFKLCVEAFAAFALQYPDIMLVCFGGGKFTREELDLFHRLALPGSRVRLFSGDDAVLQGFYCNALALVYPSLYEGFGLPLLEAMSCGCPVICSNTSSMPEVGGEAVLYFTPTEVDEIAQAMQTVVDSSEIRNKLIVKGREQVRQFSWDKCAMETAEVYRSCLRE